MNDDFESRPKKPRPAEETPRAPRPGDYVPVDPTPAPKKEQPGWRNGARLRRV